MFLICLPESDEKAQNGFFILRLVLFLLTGLRLRSR